MGQTMPGMNQMGMNEINMNIDAPNNKEEEGKELYDVNWLKENQKEFLEMEKEQQRSILGELMFRKVFDLNDMEEQKVSKITGMLIDLEILELEEIIDMLQNKESLNERVKEALEVIDTVE
jgi:hypothetical protein